jgi:asparagine synthase (glutamine-hydrolysing)
MFAIALWGKETHSLTLARDRMEEKPLYYGWQNGVLLFGSELKAMKVHPAFVGEIDRNALTLLMRFNSIPAPYSIYKGVNKLPPGTYLQVWKERDNEQEEPQVYWSFGDVVRAGRADPFSGTDAGAIEELDRVLRIAVREQMLSDVPLGAFLSGGIASSTVVALMQAQSSRPIKTFTIGFDENGYNEAEHAKAVARHLGTEHTELYISSQEAMAVIPNLPILYDEPFSDSSQIPTFLVAKMAR